MDEEPKIPARPAERKRSQPPAEEKPPARSRIYIVDDHAMFREGLRQLIDHEPDLVVCGDAAGAEEALPGIAATHPGLVIVDISLGGTSGIDLIKSIKAQYEDLPVLVVSMHDESLYAERAFRAGARGYIMKQEASESVVQAIRQVLKGGLYASSKVTENILTRFIEGPKEPSAYPLQALTDREIEVFQLIGEGLSISEIGHRLHLSVKTIGTYRERIKEKLNLKNATELLRYALNWVEQERPSKE